MRSVTCSLALGMAGVAFGSSAGLVVTALKAASAASRGSPGRRGRLVMASSLLLIARRGTESEMAAIAKWRLLGLLTAAQRDSQVLRHRIAHGLERGAAMGAVTIGLALTAAAGAPHHEVAGRQLGPERPIGWHRRRSGLRCWAWRDRRRLLAGRSRRCRGH